jgi:hypothetical protein
MNEKLALDSQRSKDESGHLKVARTVLSKAAVNPYFGREIPDYLELGLDPDKVYKLLRDPSALEAGADTFKGKQLLIKHEYVDSKKPEKELVIGTVGSNIEYEDGKLYGDITVWDAEAIELIESEKMAELSASYWYKANMVPGEFQGEAYDGTMLDIHGNHVALVARGRIGRDAIISDKLPFELEFHMLKKGTKQRVAAKLQTLAKGGIANDSDVEEVIREVAENIEHKPSFDEAKLRELAGDNYDAIVEMLGGKAAEDEVPEKPEGGADKPAEDEEDEEAEELEEERKETAMDADAIAASVQARIEGKYAARDKVEPLVGRIALDGFKDASAIYAYALKQKGIACDGVNEAGLAQLVAMAASQSKRPQVALDSAMHEPSALTSRFRKA